MKAGSCTAPLSAAAGVLHCLIKMNQYHHHALILSNQSAFPERCQDSSAVGAERVHTVPVEKQSALPCSAALQGCGNLYHNYSGCASKAACACKALKLFSPCIKLKEPILSKHAKVAPISWISIQLWW